MPRRKETVTMRLDAGILEWLRRERGYLTRTVAEVDHAQLCS
jgi:uncharacterized protein (DUF4415 family)